MKSFWMMWVSHNVFLSPPSNCCSRLWTNLQETLLWADELLPVFEEQWWFGDPPFSDLQKNPPLWQTNAPPKLNEVDVIGKLAVTSCVWGLSNVFSLQWLCCFCRKTTIKTLFLHWGSNPPVTYWVPSSFILSIVFVQSPQENIDVGVAWWCVWAFSHSSSNLCCRPT